MQKSLYSIEKLITLSLGIVVCATVGATSENRLVDFQILHQVSEREKSYRAINTQEEWLKYLKSTSFGSNIDPEIDFTKSTLLVASLGPSTGHAVIFSDIRETKDIVYAHLLDTSPAPHCAFPQIVTYPSAAAVIPHTNKTIIFQIKHAYVECDVAPIQINASPP
jgi:hypothetical protein